MARNHEKQYGALNRYVLAKERGKFRYGFKFQAIMCLNWNTILFEEKLPSKRPPLACVASLMLK